MSSSSASLEVSFPSAHSSRVALVARRQPAFPDFRPAAACIARAGFRHDAVKTAQLELADARGGSFDPSLRLASEMPGSRRRDSRHLRPVVQVQLVKPIRTLATGPAISSTTASIAPSDCVMHRRVLHRRGVPLRQSDIRGLAGRSDPPSVLRFSPGGAPGIFAPRRFVPANGWSGHFCPSGPTCRFSPRVRPDLFSSGDRSPRANRPGTFSFTRRSTSGLRSRLRSASRSSN